jgi:hypothetical protein
MNSEFMKTSELEAMKGLIHLVETVVFPGTRIYRFGSSNQPSRWFAGPWWLTRSPYEALKQYAGSREQTLKLAARRCLAVEFGWSQMDVLLMAVVKQNLSAWSGTPKTQAVKGGVHLGRLKPDRDITQLYIPGLGEPDSISSCRETWQNALHLTSTLYI